MALDVQTIMQELLAMQLYSQWRNKHAAIPTWIELSEIERIDWRRHVAMADKPAGLYEDYPS